MALNEEAQRLREAGRLQEARAASESALRMLPEGLANRRQSEAYLLQNLALTGTALGRLAAAEAAFRRALDIWNGSPAWRVAAQQQLGQLLIEQSQTGEAEVLLYRALALAEERLEPNDRRTGVIHHVLGLLYRRRAI